MSGHLSAILANEQVGAYYSEHYVHTRDTTIDQAIPLRSSFEVIIAFHS